MAILAVFRANLSASPSNTKMKYGISIYNFCILLYICHSLAILPKTSQASNSIPPSSNLTVSVPRKVSVNTAFQIYRKAISHRSGKPVYGGHTWIFIEGTRTDGPLQIELGLIHPNVQPGTKPRPPLFYTIRSEDLGINGKPLEPNPSSHFQRWTYLQGYTSLQNAQLFDHQTGRGLVADAWMENPVYSLGPGLPPNSCYDFVERVIRDLGLRLDPTTKRLFANSTEYYTDYSSEKINERVPYVASIQREPVTDTGARVQTRVQTKVLTRVQARLFNVDWVTNPDAPSLLFERTEVIPIGLALVNAVDEARSVA
ncbi:MAG: hypothetical protein Q9168_003625 [Polycauliona sp. 1 TL-2023]